MDVEGPRVQIEVVRKLGTAFQKNGNQIASVRILIVQRRKLGKRQSQCKSNDIGFPHAQSPGDRPDSFKIGLTKLHGDKLFLAFGHVGSLACVDLVDWSQGNILSIVYDEAMTVRDINPLRIQRPRKRSRI